MLFWELPSGRRLVCTQKDQSWDTWSSKVGFGVMGIWRAGDDRSDINAVSVDPSKELVAVADDDGTVCFHEPCSDVAETALLQAHSCCLSPHPVSVMQVRLARYPCVMRGAALLRYRAHAAHITSVRWISQGKRLVSTGGRDACVVQWRVKRSSSERGAPAASGWLPDASTLQRRSTAQFQFTNSESVLAEILGTSRCPAKNRLSCTVQQTNMRSHGSFAATQATRLLGANCDWLRQAGQHMESVPRTASNPVRSTPRQLPEHGTQTWTSKAAKAESKSKVLANRMSMLEHIQTALDSELQDLKRTPRYILLCLGPSIA